MAIFTTREGNLSVFRIGIFAAIIGVGLGVASFVAFQLDQAQRHSPFHIEVYPEASEWYIQDISQTSRRVYYQVGNATPAEVAQYYQNELDDHYDQNPSDINRPERCIRTPDDGQFRDYVEGSGNLPYFHRCVFDNSTFNATQFTTVTIQPGVLNTNVDPTLDTRGLTIIEYEQVWEG